MSVEAFPRIRIRLRIRIRIRIEIEMETKGISGGLMGDELGGWHTLDAVEESAAEARVDIRKYLAPILLQLVLMGRPLDLFRRLLWD